MTATDRSTALRYLALKALDEGRLEEAVNLLRGATEANRSDAKAWNDLGVVMETLGNPSTAARCYTEALAVDPFHSEARMNLGSLQMETAARRQLKALGLQAVMSRSRMGSSSAARASFTNSL